MPPRKKYSGTPTWATRPTTASGEPSLLLQLDDVATWRLSNRAQIWNVLLTRGTLVRYFPEPNTPMKFVETQTESDAWVIGNELVVNLVGVAGPVNCDHLQIRKPLNAAELFGAKETP